MINDENSLFTISTDLGSLGVKPSDNGYWEVHYFSLNEDPEIFNGNEILRKWDEKSPQIKIPGGFKKLPYFNKTLPYNEALEISSYFLSKILPKENSQNKSLN